MAMFMNAKKKKSKTPTTDANAATNSTDPSSPAATAGQDDAPVDSFFAGIKKKKKSKDSSNTDASVLGSNITGNASILGGLDQLGDASADASSKDSSDDINSTGNASNPSSTAVCEGWLGSDRDYTYTELLSRANRLIRANNPDLYASEGKKKIAMVLPQVAREGSKKVSFQNINEVCKKLHRTPEHLIAFLLAELGTTGSVDAEGALIVKGRFQQKQIEAVIKRYVQEYVQCKTCKSPDTVLTKENRLYFQKCEVCGSSRSVSAIRSVLRSQAEKKMAAQQKKANAA